MARLLDGYPNSDDDVPDISSFLKQSSGNIMKTPKPLSKTPGRMLVPKSTVKPSTRKIRRLRDVSTQMGKNPLFQKWDGEPDESPRKSPTKARQAARGFQSSFEESDFEPALVPATVLRPKSKRPTKEPNIKEDSDDSDVFGGNGTPQIKVRGIALDVENVTGSDMSQSAQTDEGKSSFAELEAEAEAEVQNEAESQFGSSSQLEAPASPTVVKVLQALNEETDSELHEDSATSAAAYESSEFSNNTYSDFDSFDSFGSVGNKTSAKLLFQKKPHLSAPKAAPSQPDETVLSEIKNTTIAEEWDEESVTGDLIQTMLDLQLQDSMAAVSRPMTPAELAIPAATMADSHNTQHTQVEGVAISRPTTPTELVRPVTPHVQEDETRDIKIEEPAPSQSASPSKHICIPKTPHRHSTDAFWDQEATNDWNDKHSPRKLILPAVNKSPVKLSPSKDARKVFDAKKQQLAQDFLVELDDKVTEGQIAALAETTGGVKLVWSRTLNTTAGRANWKRETVRNKHADGTETDVRHKHHASIELAEKVIDDETRLLNVMAHEFCHLANFMVNGITNNPHGKEFKVWAAKCSRTFADRSIKVTTKHTYEIDFKYIWECVNCGNAHKRHSRSIDPSRHRCGTCKGELKQIRPVPRASAGKPSEYQVFVKEQSKVVRAENKGVPQKEIMRIIAERWAARGKEKEQEKMADVMGKMVDLTLEKKE